MSALGDRGRVSVRPSLNGGAIGPDCPASGPGVPVRCHAHHAGAGPISLGMGAAPHVWSPWLPRVPVPEVGPCSVFACPHSVWPPPGCGGCFLCWSEHHAVRALGGGGAVWCGSGRLLTAFPLFSPCCVPCPGSSVFDDSKEGTLWRRSLVDTIVESKGLATLSPDTVAKVRLLQSGVGVREAPAAALSRTS